MNAKSWKHCAAFVVVLIALGGCKDKAKATGGASSAPAATASAAVSAAPKKLDSDGACTAYANARCGKANKCLPKLSGRFRDDATCKKRRKRECLRDMKAPESNTKPLVRWR